MSEKIITKESQETLSSGEHHELLTARATPEKSPAEAPKALSSEEARNAVAETIRSDIQTNPLERLEAAEKASEPISPSHVSRDLKQVTLRRELQQIRRKLPAPQRALSRVIHQPVVRAVSEGAGRTISRPSGMLGGGLVAFVGSALYLYLTKHVGFKYNYLVFLMLFAGGFALGLLLEFLVFAATASRRSQRLD